ncbi:hypothetical protein ACPESR_11910, partial [Nocardia testacea]
YANAGNAFHETADGVAPLPGATPSATSTQALVPRPDTLRLWSGCRFDRPVADGDASGGGGFVGPELAVFVREVTPDEGRRLQKVTKACRQPISTRRAIMVMASAQNLGNGRTVPAISWPRRRFQKAGLTMTRTAVSAGVS